VSSQLSTENTIQVLWPTFENNFAKKEFQPFIDTNNGKNETLMPFAVRSCLGTTSFTQFVGVDLTFLRLKNPIRFSSRWQ
jgi:hypothetical protein